MSVWAGLMTIAGGLFAGGAATFAWSRVAIWRTMPASAFVDDFGRTDSPKPTRSSPLLVVAIAASIGFAVTGDGAQRVLTLVAAEGFLAVLIACLAVLVPLQRRITIALTQRKSSECVSAGFAANSGARRSR